MTLLFEKLRFRNFFQYGNYWTEISLETPGPTLITGKNGVGKSTICDALSFVLFGKAFRDVNKPKLVNALNLKDCVVEVEFRINTKKYLIRRGIEPTLFEIFEDGKLVDQNSHSRDYQSFLEENILQLNHKTFCQVVVLGKANYTPFMKAVTAERRFSIEELLDIQIFSAMNKILKDDQGTAKEQLKDLSNKIELATQKRDLIFGYIKQAQQDNDVQIIDNQTKIAKLNKDRQTALDSIDILLKKRKDLTQGISKRDTLLTHFQKLVNLHQRIEDKITRLDKDIQFFETIEQCPTCEQVVPIETRQTIVADRLSKKQITHAGLEDLQKHQHETEEDLKKISEILQKIQAIDGDIDVHQRDSTRVEERISLLQKEIDKLLNIKKSASADHETQKRELEDQLEVLKKTRDDLIDAQHYRDTALLMLKDTGIKTTIIRQYLPVINQYFKKYLGDFDMGINMFLDDTFREVVRGGKEDGFVYNQFSEGQKLRIDLSIIFTWREVAKIKSGTDTNLLIMDEIFDSSLDDDGTDQLLKLIRSIAKTGVNVFVISQYGDLITDKFTQTLQVQERLGFSHCTVK